MGSDSQDIYIRPTSPAKVPAELAAVKGQSLGSYVIKLGYHYHGEFWRRFQSNWRPSCLIFLTLGSTKQNKL